MMDKMQEAIDKMTLTPAKRKQLEITMGVREPDKFHSIYTGSFIVDVEHAVREACNKNHGKMYGNVCYLETKEGEKFEAGCFFDVADKPTNRLHRAALALDSAKASLDSMGSHDTEHYSACGYDDYCGEEAGGAREYAAEQIKEAIQQLGWEDRL